MTIVEQEVEFQSQGVTCRGLFVRPDSTQRVPLIVLAHGLGGVYEMRLVEYARRFAAVGYAALTFDYRYFGRSDGHPRHLLEVAEQQRDIEAAITFGRTLDGVDPARTVLWGTSLAGGHMIDVTSRHSDIAATIIQAPFTDGLASFAATSILSMLGVGVFAAADLVSRALGGGPVLVPLAAPPGLPALMTKRDAVAGVLELLPEGTQLSGQLSRLYRTFAQRTVKLGRHLSTSKLAEPFPVAGFVGSLILPSGTALINGVSANFGLAIPFWRPGKNLAKVRSPILVCVCERDSVAPAGPTKRYARSSPHCELTVYPYEHFEIYVGEPWEVVLRDQLAFLARVVPLRVEADRQPSVTPRALAH